MKTIVGGLGFVWFGNVVERRAVHTPSSVVFLIPPKKKLKVWSDEN
jgi:hypothetical protein